MAVNHIPVNKDFIRFHRQLSACYPTEEAKAIARLVFETRFHWSMTDILLDKDRHFSSDEHADLQRILSRLLRKEPVQYILGETEFCGLILRVEPGVLIPRPETEELVRWIVSEYPSGTKQILDIGTGSGCISIALSHFLPEATITAMDTCPAVLQTAARNIEASRAAVSLELRNILKYTNRRSNQPLPPPSDNAPWHENRNWDIIVSNPPYICRSEAVKMDENVLNFEPHLALFVDDNDPLLFYRAIARYACHNLAPGGNLYLEINERFGQETCALLSDSGFTAIELRKDFCGKERMIRCSL